LFYRLIDRAPRVNRHHDQTKEGDV
jgi:hypothetical protein